MVAMNKTYADGISQPIFASQTNCRKRPGVDRMWCAYMTKVPTNIYYTSQHFVIRMCYLT